MNKSIDVAEALAFMAEKAMEMGISGVAVAVVIPMLADPKLSAFVIGTIVVNAYEVVPTPESPEVPEQGVNLLGVALIKFAEMYRTQENSGTVNPQIGELGVHGGITTAFAGYDIFTAFSGASEDQDKEIAQWGRLKLVDMIAATLPTR